MTRLALALTMAGLCFGDALPVPGFPIAEGLMTRYAPGKMRAAVEYQIGQGKLSPQTRPYMAVTLLDCDHIGIEVWLEWPDGSWTGPHPVADCSAGHHLAANRKRGIAVEVSYGLAQARGKQKGKFHLPRDAPLAGVTVYQTWPDGPARPN